MISRNEWLQFSEKASAVMRNMRDDKMSLDEAVAFFENAGAISDPDLLRYVVDVLCEIGGSPDDYTKLLQLFESGVTEDELKRFFYS